MKIDPRIPLQPGNQPDQVNGPRTSGVQPRSGAKASGPAHSTGEDTVSISSAHSEVQALTANLNNVPEVRTDRVSALQQQVSNGRYQPDSQKIADALVTAHSRTAVLA